MWLRTQGYSVISEPGRTTEMDSFTCRHCQRVVMVHARQRPEDLGGRCSICDGLICPTCVTRGYCEPFEEKLRTMEDPAYKRRRYHKIGR